jgi:hypothetical protein
LSDYCTSDEDNLNALVDTGADGCYISEKLARRLKISLVEKRIQTPVVLADSSSSYVLKYEIIPLHTVHEFEEIIVFDILPSLQFDVILGLSWFRRHRPIFDWTSMTLSFPDLIADESIDSDSSDQPDPTPPDLTLPDTNFPDPNSPDTTLPDPNFPDPTFDDSSADSDLEPSVSTGPYHELLANIQKYRNDTSKLNTLFDELSFYLNFEEKMTSYRICSVHKSISLTDQYLDFADVFSEEMADVLPENRKYDCAIDLIDPNVKPPFKSIYHLSPKEAECLRQYIDKNLKKGFIRPSKSPFGSPIFFVPKKTIPYVHALITGTLMS